jgi:hypothetical protein
MNPAVNESSACRVASHALGATRATVGGADRVAFACDACRHDRETVVCGAA